MARHETTLLVRGRWVVTGAGVDDATLSDGAVLVRGDRIEAVGTAVRRAPEVIIEELPPSESDDDEFSSPLAGDEPDARSPFAPRTDADQGAAPERARGASMPRCPLA